MNSSYLAQQFANQHYEQAYLATDMLSPGNTDATRIGQPDPQTDLLSIVMPVWAGGEITKKALQAIVDHTRRPLEIVIIDNGSDPEAKTVIEDFTRLHPAIVRLIHNATNMGYPNRLQSGFAGVTGQISGDHEQRCAGHSILGKPDDGGIHLR